MLLGGVSEKGNPRTRLSSSASTRALPAARSFAMPRNQASCITTTRRLLLTQEDDRNVAEGQTPNNGPWCGLVRFSVSGGQKWLGVASVDLLTGRSEWRRSSPGTAEVAPSSELPGLPRGPVPSLCRRGLCDLLAKHLASQGLMGADEQRLVFEAPLGGPLRYANWRRGVWLPATVVANCPGAGFHYLRRASATALVIRSRQCANRQARLGDSDPRLTLSLNVPLVEEADRRAAETVGSQFLSARTGDERAMERRRARNSDSRNPR